MAMNGALSGSIPQVPKPHSALSTAPRSGMSSPKREGDIRSKASQQQLSAALEDWKMKTASSMVVQPDQPAFTSPCFFHNRFDDAINLQKVLEEIAGDEGMSHSKLVLTATGVREVAKQLQRKPIKRAVRNVMIVTKARDNNLVTLTRELAEWLLTTPRYGSGVGVNVYVDEKLRQSKRFDASGLITKNPQFENMLCYWTPDLCWTSSQLFDLVLTLGGDGTVLFTSWLFQGIVPPVLSFSLGSLGFLTPFDFAHYRDHLNRVMGGLANSIPTSPKAEPGVLSPPASISSSSASESGMRINLRMRFTCTVYRAMRNSRTTSSTPISTAANSSPSIFPQRPPLVDESLPNSSPPIEQPQPEQFEVLNELVIDRGPSPYVSLLHLFGDGQPLTTIQADGIILSTPTGSTAYSLSAGGSLVHPDIPAILLTPICPHTLSFRPMLLNDTMLLTVKVPNSSRANAWCSFDGKGRVELRQGDSVDIKASRFPFPTVVGGKGDQWVDSISRTLRWNTRGVTQKGWGARHTVPGFESEAEEASLDGLDGAEPDEEPEEAYDIDISEEGIGDGLDSMYGDETSSRAGNGSSSPAPWRKVGSMPYLSALNI